VFGIVGRLWTGKPRNCVSISDRVKRFNSSLKRPSTLVSTQPHFEWLCRDLSPRVKRRRMKLTTHLHISEVMQKQRFSSTSRHVSSWCTLEQFYLLPSFLGARVGVVVKALRYKPAGRGFDSRWYHWNFSVT